ncbi:hypothetical protein ACTFIU_006149 [Dictyostelium citrinum]
MFMIFFKAFVNFSSRNDCGIYGQCNNLTGVCNHQGPNCSLPFKQYPTGLNSLICSCGLKFCNNQTGVCDCDSDHQGLDYSLICSGDNNCNNQTGEESLYVWFGDTRSNSSILIGIQKCQCYCINNYYSFDCSLKRNNDSGNNGGNPSIVPSTGGTNITDNHTFLASSEDKKSTYNL